MEATPLPEGSTPSRSLPSVAEISRTMTESIQVKVLFFASAREAAGGTTEAQVVLVANQATTTALRQRLAHDYPSLSGMVLDEDSITLALNEEYVGAGEVLDLKSGDCVALIPPISGG
jgi:molybdopterin converting factor subunit 1